MSTLTTERLLLKPASQLNLDGVAALDQDPEVMRYITNGKTKTLEESKTWLDKILRHNEDFGFGLMPVHLKSNDAFIGWAGVKKLDDTDLIELGYRFLQPYWGQGYATEASTALLYYAKRTLKLDCITAITLPLNKASAKVLTKCGFKFTKKSYFYKAHVDFYELDLTTFKHI